MTVCSFTIYFVDPDRGLRHSSRKGGNFEIGDIGTSAHLYWRLKKILCLSFLLFFGDKITAFKCSLDLCFYPSIIEFRIKEKTHTKAAVDVSRCCRKGFSVFLGDAGRGLVGTFVSSKVVPEDLNMKFRSKFNHDFINRGCLHCAILKACKGRDMFEMRFSRF